MAVARALRTAGPVFNCPDNYGEPGPHIGVCFFDEGKTAKHYSKYVLGQCTVDKADEKTLIDDTHAFKSYIWRPVPYDLAVANWQQSPQANIDEWLNWHLYYLEKLKALFFHDQLQ